MNIDVVREAAVSRRRAVVAMVFEETKTHALAVHVSISAAVNELSEPQRFDEECNSPIQIRDMHERSDLNETGQNAPSSSDSSI
jgi:hypothetical protein